MSSDLMIRGLVIVVCIHIILFLSQIFLVNMDLPGIPNFSENQVLGYLFNLDDTTNKIVGLSNGTSDAIPQTPQKVSVSSGDNAFLIVDELNLIWNFMRLLMGLITAPITVFLILPGLNLAFVLIFGAIITIMYIMGFIFLLRGAG